MATVKVLIPMADYGHDPTETAVPYSEFKKAGFEVHFATETGKAAQCDPKMLYGLTQKLLGATKSVVILYESMAQSPEFSQPLAWSSPGFSLDGYTLLFLPGGHDTGVRQLYNDATMSRRIAAFFPRTRRPSRTSVASICHGVLALTEAKIEGDDDGGGDGNGNGNGNGGNGSPDQGKSVIHACRATTLPARFEQTAFWATRMFLGDYYKTYGAGSEDVEESVRKAMDNPEKQYQSSLGMSPFVVEDDNYNYLSARFPGDAQLLAERVVELVRKTTMTTTTTTS